VVIRKTTREASKVKSEWMTIKASKRGNDVANRGLQRRLSPLRKALRRSAFSLDGEHTRLLYLTLTWDTKIDSAGRSWEKVGEDFNRFMAQLRKKFGKVHVLRSWESSARGYAHVHGLFFFPEKSFVYFEHTNAEEKTTYRIPNFWRKQIQSMWHSHVDVQAIADNGIQRLNDVLSYVVKFEDDHVDVDKWNEKELLTMTALWYFRKRQFGVSGAFFGDLTRGLEVIQTEPLQFDLDCNVITTIEYEFLGLVSGTAAGLQPSVWFKTYDKPPPFLEDVWMPHSSARSNALQDMGFA